MDRRLAGIALLVVVLVAVVLVPSLSGLRTAGSAVAKSFPPPPRVGDCLQTPFPVSVSPDVPPEIPFTATRFGSCTGAIGGEVVQFWANAAAFDAAAGTARYGPCDRSAAGFAGLDISGRSIRLAGSEPGASVRWKPSITLEPYHVVPSEQERAAGRSWVACLAAPVALLSYQGTLQAAYTTGRLPAAFGSCWSGTDLGQSPVPVSCERPHAAELLATGWTRNRESLSPGEIDESCSVLAAGIMRTSDPTRNGALRVTAATFTSGVSGQPFAAGMLGCFVTPAHLDPSGQPQSGQPQSGQPQSGQPQSGERRLSGTLVGLGDGPVPLVG